MFKQKFFPKLGDFNANPVVIEYPLQIENFWNLDLDTAGFYSLGHHDNRAFFSALRKHGSHLLLCKNSFRHNWVSFNEKIFQDVLPDSIDAKPITMIDRYL